MNTYVMSDIHGAYDEFMQMLELIKFSDEDILVVNGDIVDRGYNVTAIIDYVISHKNIIWIKGNHEDMLVKGLNPMADGFDLRLWIENGGLDLYNELIVTKTPQYIHDLSTYINRLPCYIIIGKYVIAHANMSHCVLDEMKDEDDIEEFIRLQDSDTILWDRSGVDGILLAPEGYTFIFGHTPVQRVSNGITNRIIHKDNKIYIDCGVSTCVAGQLACLRLEDMKEFYVPKIDR